MGEITQVGIFLLRRPNVAIEKMNKRSKPQTSEHTVFDFTHSLFACRDELGLVPFQGLSNVILGKPLGLTRQVLPGPRWRKVSFQSSDGPRKLSGSCLMDSELGLSPPEIGQNLTSKFGRI